MPYKDPEVRKRKHAEYVARNRDRLRLMQREWYVNNRERMLTSMKEYYAANKEKIRKDQASYYAQKTNDVRKKQDEWRASNPGYRTEAYARNSTPQRTQSALRRASTLQRVPPWFGELDELAFKEAHDLARLREKATGLKWQVDHIVPLRGEKVSGLHVCSNVQVITASANASKKNKFEQLMDGTPTTDTYSPQPQGPRPEA